MNGMTIFIITCLFTMTMLRTHSCTALEENCSNCTDWCITEQIYAPVPYTVPSDENTFLAHKHPGMDQGLLTVISKCFHNITIMIRSDECYECSFEQLVQLKPYSHSSVLVDSKFGIQFRVLAETLPYPTAVCNESVHFMQYGNYTYHISPNNTADLSAIGYICVLSSEDPPLDANFPVWILLAILVLLFSLWSVFLVLDRRYFLCARISIQRMVSNDLGVPQSSSVSTAALNHDDSENLDENGAPVPMFKARLKSLDTFRGISIILMIFVNYGGGGYWYFRHSSWNGLTVADLVFPWFIFIMGTSMVFSFQSQLRRHTPWKSILLKIVKRSVILFLLGLALNSRPRCPHRETRMDYLRIPGVLQRIGVTYLLTGLVHLVFTYKQESSKLYALLEWLVHLLLLTLYLTLTFLLPVPGCPTGYLGPGGHSQDDQYENCTGGASGYIDRVVFGADHMYQHPTSRRIYGGTTPYDPEGLLGCLTSVFLCFLGLQAGNLFTKPCWKYVKYKLLLFSILSTAMGVLLCEGQKETGWIPVNKNLWSLSYIMCMAGASYFLLALCYILVDRYKLWNGAPFIFAGMNPVLLYMCHEIFQGYLPVSFHVDSNHWSLLAMDVWGTVFWLIVAYVLHKKKIYFSI